MSTLQQDREALEKEREKAAEAYAFLVWARRHQDLNCLANINVIKSYLNGDPVTEANLEEATSLLLSKGKLAILSPNRVQENAAQEASQAVAQTARDRIDLEATLLGEIDKPEQREHVRRAIKFETTEQVQKRLDDLRLKRSLAAMEPDEIRAYIKNQRGAALAPVIETITLSKQEILALGPREYRALLYDKRGIEKPGVRIQIENIMRGQ